MAMDVGTRGKGINPAMNVTPLVDVVLVLLIVFMVMTPLLAKKFWVHTPQQEKEEVTKEQLQQDPDPPLVLHVAEDRTIQVNGQTIGFDQLAEKLKRFFAARNDHVLFFDADEKLEYGFAVEVMDRAREGGAVTIATLTEDLTATPQGAHAPAAGAAPGQAPAQAAAPAAAPAPVAPAPEAAPAVAPPR